jgi:hypothetical protein
MPGTNGDNSFTTSSVVFVVSSIKIKNATKGGTANLMAPPFGFRFSV